MLFFFHRHPQLRAVMLTPTVKQSGYFCARRNCILTSPTQYICFTAVAAGMTDARRCAPTASQTYPTPSSYPSFRLAPTVSSTKHRHLCATPPPFALVLRSAFSVGTSPCSARAPKVKFMPSTYPALSTKSFTSIPKRCFLFSHLPRTYIFTPIHTYSHFCNCIMITVLPSSLSQMFVVAAAMVKSWMSYDAQGAPVVTTALPSLAN